MALGDALIVAVSGVSVVFLMLCILWGIIVLINRVVSSLEKKETAAMPPVPMPSAPVKAEPAAPAPVQHGTFGGEVLLYDVDEKTAACIMAIVSDQTKIPLNELIFKSIRALD